MQIASSETYSASDMKIFLAKSAEIRCEPSSKDSVSPRISPNSTSMNVSVAILKSILLRIANPRDSGKNDFVKLTRIHSACSKVIQLESNIQDLV